MSHIQIISPNLQRQIHQKTPSRSAALRYLPPPTRLRGGGFVALLSGIGLLHGSGRCLAGDPVKERGAERNEPRPIDGRRSRGRVVEWDELATLNLRMY
jgi:hypothetical protein